MMLYFNVYMGGDLFPRLVFCLLNLNLYMLFKVFIGIIAIMSAELSVRICRNMSEYPVRSLTAPCCIHEAVFPEVSD